LYLVTLDWLAIAVDDELLQIASAQENWNSKWSKGIGLKVVLELLE
jgi:hypothetical protein